MLEGYLFRLNMHGDPPKRQGGPQIMKSPNHWQEEIFIHPVGNIMCI